MREESGWWLETAMADFRMAEVLSREGLYSGAAFHLQQAAEKALKALLLEHGETEPTHSGRFLMRTLERHGEPFPDNMEHKLKKLDRCFIDSRYPNGVGGPPQDLYDAETVKDLMACCSSVMELVKSRLR